MMRRLPDKGGGQGQELVRAASEQYYDAPEQAHDSVAAAERRGCNDSHD